MNGYGSKQLEMEWKATRLHVKYFPYGHGRLQAQALALGFDFENRAGQ